MGIPQVEIWWGAAIISVTAIVLFVVLAYWLFLSPMRPIAFEPRAFSAKRVDLIITILAISGAMMMVGSIWDACLHADRTSPPAGSHPLWLTHLLVDASFLLAFGTGVGGLIAIARQGWQAGKRDPRLWVRANPQLGMIVLSAFTAILLIGASLFLQTSLVRGASTWSAPHVLLVVASAAILISAVGVLMQKRAAQRRRFQRDFVIFFLLALMMNVLYISGVLDWELPGPRPAFVEARPLWSYPMIAGTIVFFTILLAKRLTVQKWAGTWTVVLFYMLRLLVTIALDLSQSIVPAFPLPFFLGVLLVDLVAWQRIPTKQARALAVSLLFTSGYALITLPILQDRPDLVGFSAWDFVWTILTTLLLSLVLLPVTGAASRRLVRHGT